MVVIGIIYSWCVRVGTGIPKGLISRDKAGGVMSRLGLSTSVVIFEYNGIVSLYSPILDT